MARERVSGIGYYIYAIAIVIFLYLPLVAVGFASISKARYLSFPIKRYATTWYFEALESSTVLDLVQTSLLIALIVTFISVVLGFFGACAVSCDANALPQRS